MIGTLIEDRYRIVEVVGEGGMGSVYKAVDEKLRRTVALKLLRGGFTDSPTLIKRFNDETQILASFNHPNITLLYDAFTWQEQPVMVMELLDGEPLSNEINRIGPIPAVRCVPWMVQALAGVAEAHQHGIIHRDLKPSNLMLTSKGIVKVMDFGIAKSDQGLSRTRTAMAIGTPFYMAPEQIDPARFGLERADQRADIYAMGVTLYELLAGIVPFQGTSEFAIQRAHIEEHAQPPTAYYPHIPPQIVAAVARAMAKHPEERFQSAAEFALAINLPEEILRKGAGDAPVQVPAFISTLTQQAQTGPVSAAITPLPATVAQSTAAAAATRPQSSTPLPVSAPAAQAQTAAERPIPFPATTPQPSANQAAAVLAAQPARSNRTGMMVGVAAGAAALLLGMGGYGIYAYNRVQGPAASHSAQGHNYASTQGGSGESSAAEGSGKPSPESITPAPHAVAGSTPATLPMALPTPKTNGPTSAAKMPTPVHSDNALVAGHWSGSYRSCDNNQETRASLQLSESAADDPAKLLINGRLLVTGHTSAGAICPVKGVLTRANNRLTLWANCGTSAAPAYLSVPYTSVLSLFQNQLNGTVHPDNPCYTIEFKRDGGK